MKRRPILLGESSRHAWPQSSGSKIRKNSKAFVSSPRYASEPMKILVFGISSFALFFALIGAIGCLLPATRTAIAQRDLGASPERVWRMLMAIERQPSWRSDLVSVEVLDGTPGRERWVERPKHGPAIHFATESQSTGASWTIVFSGPAEGRWMGRLERLSGNRTRIQIEESATVSNPWKRALAHVFFSPQVFVEKYLDELSAVTESVETK